MGTDIPSPTPTLQVFLSPKPGKLDNYLQVDRGPDNSNVMYMFNVNTLVISKHPTNTSQSQVLFFGSFRSCHCKLSNMELISRPRILSFF